MLSCSSGLGCLMLPSLKLLSSCTRGCSGRLASFLTPFIRKTRSSRGEGLNAQLINLACEKAWLPSIFSQKFYSHTSRMERSRKSILCAELSQEQGVNVVQRSQLRRTQLSNYHTYSLELIVFLALYYSCGIFNNTSISLININTQTGMSDV